MKKWLLVFLFLFLSPFKASALGKEIEFTVTNPTPIYQINRPDTYDVSPNAFEENGEIKVYVCGGSPPGDPYHGHDTIYLTVFNGDGAKVIDSQRVLWPLLSSTGDDSDMACAPSVVKHSTSGIDGGKEKYLMYYECAPKFYRKSDNVEIKYSTQICVAFSNDGIHWQKYNKELWSDPKWRFATMDEPATAVIQINPAIKQRYGIEYTNDKYWTSAMGLTGDAYGVGHPIAVVKNNEIWLYYFDSIGNIFLSKSNDGFHFFSTEKISDMIIPSEIRYVATPMFGHDGFFVKLGTHEPLTGVPYYNYSWDGVHWAYQEPWDATFYTNYLAQNFAVKPTTPGKCALGGDTLVSDPYGVIRSQDVTVVVNEGNLGDGDGCTPTNGCKCYSSAEDHVVTMWDHRGTTWDLYMYKGKFSPIPKPGDLNGDGKVDSADFNKIVVEFGHPYTIFDYNVSV